MEHVSTGTTNVEEDSKGISYLQYLPRCVFAEKLNKKLPKKQRRPLIKEGPYFCMRTRSITCKPKLDPKLIQDGWLAGSLWYFTSCY